MATGKNMSNGASPKRGQRSCSSADRRGIAIDCAAGNYADADQYLIEGARRLLRSRLHMDPLIPKDLQRHAIWNVLLELYVHEWEGTLSRVKQIMIASGEKATSAVRLIDRLEEVRFVHRAPDRTDGRCLIVRLTSLGRSIVVTMLQRLFGPEEPIASRGYGKTATIG